MAIKMLSGWYNVDLQCNTDIALDLAIYDKM